MLKRLAADEITDEPVDEQPVDEQAVDEQAVDEQAGELSAQAVESGQSEILSTQELTPEDPRQEMRERLGFASRILGQIVDPAKANGLGGIRQPMKTFRLGHEHGAALQGQTAHRVRR